MLIRVLFHVDDHEFNDSYDYEGFFFDEEELATFIRENEEVCNHVTILEKEEVPATIYDLLEGKYCAHF